MNLNEYIKRNYKNPNVEVLKALGASDELIDYLIFTPWNTNLGVIGSIGEGGGSDAEVWLVGNEYTDEEWGRVFQLSNVGETNYLLELLTNADNYDVYLNGENLPYLTSMTEPAGIAWSDAEIAPDSPITKVIYIDGDSSGASGASAEFPDASTAPTSVEVSVKAK